MEAYRKLLLPDVKYLLYGGSKGSGKAEALDSLVCTPLGFKRMGDIRVGDVVSCPDGTCSNVIAVHPQGIQKLYRVTCIDGASTLVTEDHLWLAHVVGRRSKTGQHYGVYSTRELIGLLDKAKNSKSTITPNILIPLTEPVQFTKPYRNKGYSRPVDPYVLGALPETKFIPEDYKYAPIDVRYELIRGLFDTDGYADNKGHIEFATVSKQLAVDVQWIIRSLGGKATISEKIGKYRDVICQKVYRLYINIANPEMLFHLERKKIRTMIKYNNGLGELQRRIVSIELEKEAEAQCITIRHPEGLYITDDFIVTHNSVFGRWWLVDFLVRMWRMTGQRRIRAALFCEDYPTLIDRQLTKIKTEFPSWLGEIKQTQTDGLCFFLTEEFGDGIIMLRNLDDPKKLASSEFAAMFIDELTMIPKETFDILRGTMRWKGVPETKFLGTANPGGVGMAWVKRLWIDMDFPPEMQDIAKKFAFVQALPSDNPYLTEDYWSELRSQNPEIQRAWIRGDWNTFIGMAFPSWDDSRHVIDTFVIPDYFPRYVGIDWGYEKPFCALWRAKDPDTGRSYIYREVYQTHLTDRQQARLIKEMTGNEQIRYYFADYSMWTRKNSSEIVTTSADEYAKEGIILTQADKDRMNGKRKIDRSLANLPDGRPGLHVFRNCVHLIKTLPTLVYDEHRPEDVDDKGEDHCLVGNTEIITDKGLVCIRDMKVGDKVLTRKGYKTVTKVWDNGIKLVNCIAFDNGKHITATGNHPVYLKDKFVNADTLKYYDAIVYKEINKWNLKRLYSMVSSTEGILNLKTGRIECIIPQVETISNVALGDYMRKSGNLSMGIFRKAIAFTIKTAILSTTILEILSVLNNLNIQVSIKRGKNTPHINYKKCKRVQSNGINQTLEEVGTPNMQNKSGGKKTGNFAQDNVVTADLNIQQLTSKNARISALVNAVLLTAEKGVLITKKGFALVVASLLLSINTVIRNIVPVHVLANSEVAKQRVYNLSVEGQEEYYANGVLVHNCYDSLRYSYTNELTSRKRDNIVSENPYKKLKWMR